MSMKRIAIPQQAAIISLCIVSAIAALFAWYQLYQHSKTDGFGSGDIVVSMCEEEDWDWKLYTCRGDYSSNAGLIYTRDVTVRVSAHVYKAGDTVEDVYPVRGSLADAREFITGKERSSVLYNAPWLALLFISLAVPIGAGLYVIGARMITKRKA